MTKLFIVLRGDSMIASDDKLYLGTDLIYSATPQPYKLMQEFPLRVVTFGEHNTFSDQFSGVSLVSENIDLYRLLATNNTGEPYAFYLRDVTGYHIIEYQIPNIIHGIAAALNYETPRFLIKMNGESFQAVRVLKDLGITDNDFVYCTTTADKVVLILYLKGIRPEPNRYKLIINKP